MDTINNSWSYEHEIGFIAVSGWGNPFLVVTEKKYWQTKETDKLEKREAKKEWRSWQWMIKRYAEAIVPIFICLIILSCTKVYTEKPTCRKYLKVSDKYFPDSLTYVRTDTFYFNVERVATYACDSELRRLENYKPFKEGCETGGWQRFRYIIFNP